MPEQTNEIRISNVITLDKMNLSQGILNQIKFKFSHENPKFAENRRLGFSNFQTPQTINLYQETEDFVKFPRGLIKDLFEIIPNISIDDQTAVNPVDLPDSQIQLRPYQDKKRLPP